MRYLPAIALCFATASTFAADAAAQVVATAVPVVKPPTLPASASLVSGPYTLTLSATKGAGAQALSKSTIFDVQVTSNGSTMTISTPPAAGKPAATLPTASGAFQGNNFSLQLAVGGNTLLMTATAPSSTALTTLNGSFVTAKAAAPSVAGTFSLVKSAAIRAKGIAPGANRRELPTYPGGGGGGGGGGGEGDGAGGILAAIGAFLDSLFNW